MRKKILILGNSIKTYSLSKRLSTEFDVFVAPGNQMISKFATCVDIRETDIPELLEFALENDIDLAIPTSKESIKTNLADIFSQNNISTFAPNKNSARIIFDKTYAKKIMYKLRIPTPKFGIFEKQNMAYDYIKKLTQTYVLKTNEEQSAVIMTQSINPKIILDTFYLQKNQKLIIEDYIWGTPFGFYVLTDGYKALPIGSSILLKHSLDGNGGQLTTGMGSSVPNYKLSNENIDFIMNSVIYPTIQFLQDEGTPYLGILGVNGILTENNCIQILGYEPFMQDADIDGVLSLINDNIYDLMKSCIIGSFSDEIEEVSIIDSYTASLTINCINKNNIENIIYGLNNLDEDTIISYYNNVTENKYLEYLAYHGPNFILTTKSATNSSAKRKLYEEVSEISFNGISYRKDLL